MLNTNTAHSINEFAAPPAEVQEPPRDVIEEIYRNDELTHDYRKGDMVWVLWLLAFASAMIEVAIIYGITRLVELTSGG